VIAETLYIYADDDRSSRLTIDAALFAREKVTISPVSLTDEEKIVAVQLSAQMDDGEAETLAIASRRGLIALSDDAAARRAAPSIGVVLEDILDLLYAWGMQAQPAEAEAVAKALRLRANYAPPRRHSLRQWYLDLLS
jgi:predicted nucleic acid-binding protein